MVDHPRTAASFGPRGRPAGGRWRLVGAGLLLALALGSVPSPGLAQPAWFACDAACQAALTVPPLADAVGDDAFACDAACQAGLDLPVAGAVAAGGELTPVADADGDGLTDGEEAALGTDPTVRDTDRDGLSDLCDSAPLDPWSGFSTCVGLP